MPTYKNISTQNIRIDDTLDSTNYVSPNTTIQTYKFYDNAALEFVSVYPLYTPVIDITTVSSTGVDDDKTVDIDVSTEYITLYSTDTEIDVFNELLTHLLITLSSGGVWSWESQGRTRQLLLHFKNAGTCTVIQSYEDIVSGSV